MFKHSVSNIRRLYVFNVNYKMPIAKCFHVIIVMRKNLLQVDMVIVPATTAQMGILPGHVPTIAELKPGLLSVHEGNETKKCFISSGFAFIHPNSIADILAVEAVPLDRIDPARVQKGLTEFTQKLSSASTDSEKVIVLLNSLLRVESKLESTESIHLSFVIISRSIIVLSLHILSVFYKKRKFCYFMACIIAIYIKTK
ncbi:putative ATP synthase, F1 complex, delta/epsilon subunit, F0F1 ATP synthase delta/epsilon subunit [Helianthus anomalus]